MEEGNREEKEEEGDEQNLRWRRGIAKMRGRSNGRRWGRRRKTNIRIIRID